MDVERYGIEQGKRLAFFMMRYSLLFISIVCSNFLYGQKVREYFFGDRLQINDSTALLVKVERAQTEVATQIGHRIYTDTSFIRKIKNSFYEEFETDEREGHMCDYDLYFYAIKGNQAVYLNKLNSRCGLHQINCKSEDGLALLLESGRKIRVDTLYQLPENKDSLKSILGSKNVIMSYRRDTDEWYLSASKRLPKLYYDGYFETIIPFDTTNTITENINRYFKSIQFDPTLINWSFRNIQDIDFDATDRIWKKKKYQQDGMQLAIYIKESMYYLFEKETIIPTTYKVNPAFPLLIFYKN